jgi:hypothetical protein
MQISFQKTIDDETYIGLHSNPMEKPLNFPDAAVIGLEYDIDKIRQELTDSLVARLTFGHPETLTMAKEGTYLSQHGMYQLDLKIKVVDRCLPNTRDIIDIFQSEGFEEIGTHTREVPYRNQTVPLFREHPGKVVITGRITYESLRPNESRDLEALTDAGYKCGVVTLSDDRDNVIRLPTRRRDPITDPPLYVDGS